MTGGHLPTTRRPASGHGDEHGWVRCDHTGQTAGIGRTKGVCRVGMQRAAGGAGRSAARSLFRLGSWQTHDVNACLAASDISDFGYVWLLPSLLSMHADDASDVF